MYIHGAKNCWMWTHNLCTRIHTYIYAGVDLKIFTKSYLHAAACFVYTYVCVICMCVCMYIRTRVAQKLQDAYSQFIYTYTGM